MWIFYTCIKWFMKDSYCTQFEEQHPKWPDISLGSWGQRSFITGRITRVETALSNYFWCKVWWVPEVKIIEQIRTLHCQAINNTYRRYQVSSSNLYCTDSCLQSNKKELCKVIMLFLSLPLCKGCAVFPQNNLHNCLTVTFSTFSIQMSSVENRGHVRSFLFSICKRILNRDTWSDSKLFGLG